MIVSEQAIDNTLINNKYILYTLNYTEIPTFKYIDTTYINEEVK